MPTNAVPYIMSNAGVFPQPILLPKPAVAYEAFSWWLMPAIVEAFSTYGVQFCNYGWHNTGPSLLCISTIPVPFGCRHRNRQHICRLQTSPNSAGHEAAGMR